MKSYLFATVPSPALTTGWPAEGVVPTALGRVALPVIAGAKGSRVPAAGSSHLGAQEIKQAQQMAFNVRPRTDVLGVPPRGRPV
jgi:hypothetical protein